MRKIILLLFFTSVYSVSFSQRKFTATFQTTQAQLLIASAGEDLIFLGNNPVLGNFPAAIGGTLPYSYNWIPANNLDNPSASNPLYLGEVSTQYLLVVTDEQGCTSRDTIQVIVLNTSESFDSKELVIYPNPGTGIIRLVKPENLNLKNTTVHLIDVSGKKVLDTKWDSKIGDYLLDVNRFSKGQYILLVVDEKMSFTRKIIIQ